MRRSTGIVYEGVTVYGIYSSLDPDEIRYVGQTKSHLGERFGWHLGFLRAGKPRTKFSAKYKQWGQDVLKAGGEVLCVNLTKIKAISEHEWADELSSEGHRLFNVQFTGRQSEILKTAWLDPVKRANMSAHHQKLHAQTRKNPATNGAAIRWQRKTWKVADSTKEEIRKTLKGKKNGPYSLEHKINVALGTKLWHRNLKPTSANSAWLNLLIDVTRNGSIVTPRGRKTREILGSLIVVDMTQPVITIAERKMGYRFMCAEAAMILDGDDKVSTIAPYSKMISSFSDDGDHFFGAYGTKFRSQLDYVVKSLKKDPSTRQAVFNIWRENPPETRDCPCTLSSHFMIRNNQLDTFVTMRSNDVWLGTCYDIFSASMWSAYVLLRLNAPKIRLGNLYHIAASRHLYEENFEDVKRCLNGMTIGFKYEPLHVKEFAKPNDLSKHLWAIARKEPLKYKWLKELTK